MKLTGINKHVKTRHLRQIYFYPMKNLFFLFLLLVSFGKSFAQECDNQRYYEELFNYTVTADIKFGENVQPTPLNPNNIQELFMDIYQPDGDTLSARPLIIWAFGGGFIFGNKESDDVVTLSTAFAKRGYVCASIDYRLSTDLVFNGDLLNVYEAVWKAMHDMRASIRFFYKDAATNNDFRIDTSRIYIGGVSAGAISALQIVHFDELNELPVGMESLFQSTGGFEGNSGNQGYSDNVAGVISLCGALLDTAWINPAITIPIVSMHGTADNVVPYGSDTLTLLNIAVEVDGSASIHHKLDQHGITNDFYSWQGANHTPFILNPNSLAEAYMDTTIWFVRDFLYDLVCGGVTSTIETTENEIFSIDVFPNPSSGNFFIDIHSDEKTSILIFNNIGREVLSYPDMHQGLNRLEVNLPTGIYFISVYSTMVRNEFE